MTTATTRIAPCLALAASLALATPAAFASAQRTFVASYGVDVNACSLVSPCRSFGVALAKTSAGGEVIVLDSAGYGSVAITQAVSITAPSGVYAGISVSAGVGVTVNAGAGHTVTLRGLTINALGGTTGIAFQSGDALYVDKSVIAGFAGGVALSASVGSAASRLVITDSALRDNATGLATTTTTGTLTLSVERTRFERNGEGADLQGATSGVIRNSQFAAGTTGVSLGHSGSEQAVKIELRNCTLSDNAGAAISLAADSSPSSAMVIGSEISGNGSGLQAMNAGNLVYASDNTIVRNGTALSALAGGILVSNGDNRVLGNVTDGAFSSTGNFPPVVNAGNDQTITLPSTASLSGSFIDDGNPPGSPTVQWTLVSGPGPVVFGNATNVSTTATFTAPGAYVLRLTANDTQLSGIDDVVVTVNPDPSIVLPPDPASVAPPVDGTVGTGIGASSAFLYTGANPIQTGVTPATIDPTRAGVVRGKVMTPGGAPVPGVTVSILNHPELGQTLSRADGMFDLAVNAGGPLTVSYVKPGLLTAQRTLPARWQRSVVAPDVAMIPLQSTPTIVDLASPTPIQVVRGDAITDTDGTRRATLLFAAGTTASMMLPGGGASPIARLTVRATEYTVGPTGPNAMPGELPPTSSYTYAAEFSVDEAIVAGATSVLFNQPVVSYTENFLSFPVGWNVPFGQYDRQAGAWIASPNGRVVKILGVSAGAATLDIDGSGLPASPAALAALGVTTAEQQTLATLYAIGQSLWRVPMTHFSPGDMNWGGGLPPGAAPPNNSPPNDKQKPDSCKSKGSIIECQNQVLGESIPIVGTPFSLNYRSSRVPGFKSSNRLRIPLSGATLPPNVHAIDTEVLIAGRKFTQNFPALPNQSTTFVWDGKDAYGRTMQGPQVATVRVGYEYLGVYTQPAGFLNAFAQYGSAISSNDARTVLTLWQEWQASIGLFDMNAAGLGGWNLSPHHVYDPGGQTLYRGDGDIGNAAATHIDNIIETFAGNGGPIGCQGDLGPATQATLFDPEGVAAAADGSVYVVDVNDYVVRRVGPDGIIKTVAGIPHLGCKGDNTPATNLSFATALGVAVAPDGSFYVSDYNGEIVYRIGTEGSVVVAAGTGAIGSTGDGGPATLATLSGPRGLAVAADGTLYIATPNANRVRRVGTDGIITTVAGTGVNGFSGDNGFATQAKLSGPIGVAVGPDGALYISDEGNHRVRRVGTDGIITTFAGISQFGFGGDGGPATAAALSNPEGIATGPDGSVYVTDNNRIRRIAPDGIINTIAGGGGFGFGGDGGAANQAKLQVPRGVAVGPDGSVYISDSNNSRIRRIRSPLPGFATTDVLVASDGGSEVYRFDALGRHLTTLDPYTGAVLYTFGYDAGGRLITVTDVANNVTTIQRTNGAPTGILGPYGAQTTLTRDANGFLASIANPVGETYVLASTADGLLSTLTDPRGGLHTFTYDALGRLTLDHDAAGGSNALARVDGNQTFTVSRTSALARVTSYEVDTLGNGDEHRVNTEPSGLATVDVHGANAIDSTTFADGSTVSQTFGPDPRWGLFSPIAQTASYQTPAGKTLTTNYARTVVLANAADPLSLTSQSDTFTLNGRVYANGYTAATRTYAMTTAGGRSRTIAIDADGRPIQLQWAGLEAVSRTFDAHGRLATVTWGSGLNTRTWTFAYDGAGYVDTVTDPIGRSESFSYDLAGRPIQHTRTDGAVTHFTYDANGNTATLTPPSRPQHAFSYTPVDLLSQYVPPSVGAGNPATSYTFNADRQLTLVSRPDGQTIAYAYDTAGRQNAVTIARGTFTYAYDPSSGNLTSITAPGAVGLAFSFDGALVTGTTWSGPVTGTVTQTYDNDFRASGLAVNGSLVSLSYDADSLLTQAGLLTLSYDPQNGRLTGTIIGNVADTWVYNGFAEPVTYTASYNGAAVFTQQFTRDKLGRIVQKDETIGGVADTYVYSYDLAGRLTGVSKNGSTVATYAYDANGNRLSATTNGAPILGTYDNQDRLTQYGNASYAYTANGDLQTRTLGPAVTSFQYDELGNLMAVTLPTGTAITYVVDGRNRRIGKKLNGTLVQGFLYQDALKPIAELDGANNVVSRFVYATRDNVPDYMIRSGVTYRIVTDTLGSVRLVIDVATGTIIQRVDYDEFGQVAGDTNPGFQPFGFAGGVYDHDTNLVRFGARDYDGQAGRWTAKDPIRFASAATNLYAYVSNDPVNSHDATGLQDDGGSGGQGGGAGGGAGGAGGGSEGGQGGGPGSCPPNEPGLLKRLRWFLFGKPMSEWSDQDYLDNPPITFVGGGHRT